MWIGSLIIFRDRAYIPVMSKTENGLYVGTTPVEVVGLEPDLVADDLQKAMSQGNPLILNDDASVNHDPILDATGSRNWLQLARNGASYGIVWDEHIVEINMSMLDSRKRFVSDPEKKCHLTPPVKMVTVADIIINDWNSRTDELSGALVQKSEGLILNQPHSLLP